MPAELLQDDSPWVLKYREKPEPSSAALAGHQRAAGVHHAVLLSDDALINDLARCVADCEMDTLELVYFLGQCGHDPATALPGRDPRRQQL